MKKLFLLFAMGAAAIGVSAQNAPKLESIGDSIAYYIGNSEGAYTLAAGAEMANSGVDSDELTKAFKSAINQLFTLQGDVDVQLQAFKRALEMRQGFEQMQKNGIDVNLPLFLESFNASISGPVQPLDSVRAHSAFVNGLVDTAYGRAQAERERKLKETVAANHAAGEKYIANLKKKDKKLRTTESGLVYKVTKTGKGIGPVATDKVKVHYTGKLIDGTVFDSSVERGEPAVFEAGNLIKGFTEGLMLMHPGGKATFYIPSNLAYGDAETAGGKIPAGSTLVFDVELLEINPQQ